jgi:hypothetical protein
VVARDRDSFHDDVDKIGDGAVLLRRVSPKLVNWRVISEGESPPVPSQGFQDYSDDKAREEFGLPGACMSVAVEDLVTEEGREPADLIVEFPGYGLAAVTAGELRALKGPAPAEWAQGVMWDRTDNEPWHAVVYCQNGVKKTKGIERAIAQLANWRIEPHREAS